MAAESRYPIGSVSGRVYFEWGGVTVEAVLTRQGQWIVDPGPNADSALRDACASVAEDWTRLYSPANYGPGEGIPAQHAILDVAKLTQGRPYADTPADTTPANPDVTY